MYRKTQGEWESQVSEICDRTARLASMLIKSAVSLVGLRGQLRGIEASLKHPRFSSKVDEALTQERVLLEKRRRVLESQLRDAENSLGRVEGDLTRSTARELSMVDQLSVQVDTYESEAQRLGEHPSEYFGSALARISGAEFLQELITQLEGALEHAEATLDEAQWIARTRQWHKQDQLALRPPEPPVPVGLNSLAAPGLRGDSRRPDRLRPPRPYQSPPQSLPFIGPGVKPVRRSGSPDSLLPPDPTRTGDRPYQDRTGRPTNWHRTSLSHESMGRRLSANGSNPRRIQPMAPSPPGASYRDTLAEPQGPSGPRGSPDHSAHALLGAPSSPIGFDAGRIQPITRQLPDATLSCEPQVEPTGSHGATGSPDDFSQELLGTPFGSTGSDQGPIEPIDSSSELVGHGDGVALGADSEGGVDIHDDFGVSPSGDILPGTTTVRLPGGAETQLPW